MTPDQREEIASSWRRLLLDDEGRPHIGGGLILADLEAYCPDADRLINPDTSYPTDPTKLGVLIGRRQVLCRIRGYLEAPKPRKPEPEGGRRADQME